MSLRTTFIAKPKGFMRLISVVKTSTHQMEEGDFMYAVTSDILIGMPASTSQMTR